MEVDPPDSADDTQAEAAAHARQLHAQAQARYREKLRVAAADAEAARLAELEAEQRAATARFREARRAARWMQQASREGRVVAWDEMPASCRAAAIRFGFMRGIWNHQRSETGYSLGVGHLLRREWYHAWNDLPKYFKLAAIDLGYERGAWQYEDLGCPSSGCGCSQRFLPQERRRATLVRATVTWAVSALQTTQWVGAKMCLRGSIQSYWSARILSILWKQLLRANTFGYDASYCPCGYRRTNGPDHLCGGRVGDIHDGSEYSREEWSLDLRAL